MRSLQDGWGGQFLAQTCGWMVTKQLAVLVTGPIFVISSLQEIILMEEEASSSYWWCKPAADWTFVAIIFTTVVHITIVADLF